MNSMGQLLRLNTFGESHGVAIGGVLDGFPSKFTLDLEALQSFVARRKTAQHSFESSRQEPDEIELLSGLYKGQTLGSPIAFMVRNRDALSGAYKEIEAKYRPGHADYTYHQKYGIHAFAGGGRSSARETLARTIAGGMALQWLQKEGIHISSKVVSIGGEEGEPQIAKKIMEASKRGDSLGGVVSCSISGVPVGLGEPLYDKLHATLGKAMLSINACKGFEIGQGFRLAEQYGSQVNDALHLVEGRPKHRSNHLGGIIGGISNGEEIYMRLSFRPPASIGIRQQTITHKGEEAELKISGRHDSTFIYRVLPIVEAMAALVVMDHMLIYRAYRDR